MYEFGPELKVMVMVMMVMLVNGDGDGDDDGCGDSLGTGQRWTQVSVRLVFLSGLTAILEARLHAGRPDLTV
jgi:hypothetical protein